MKYKVVGNGCNTYSLYKYNALGKMEITYACMRTPNPSTTLYVSGGSERRWPIVVYEGSLKLLSARSCVLHMYFWVEAICCMLWLCSLSGTSFTAKAFEYVHRCNIITERGDMLPPPHPLSLRNVLYEASICWCWQMTLSVYNMGLALRGRSYLCKDLGHPCIK